jgi:hypothetical protein
MPSGGSSSSKSLTWSARMVTAQLSPWAKGCAGVSVKLSGPPLTAAACSPLTAQAMATPPLTVTGSLKVMVRVAVRGTAVAPSGGSTAMTSGAASISAAVVNDQA